MAKSAIVEETEKLARKPVERGERVEFIDTGSTLLNLAASQRGLSGGWARGRIVNIVGDGSSGKTLLSLEACAHAFYNLKAKPSALYPPIKELFIVYNNVEGVMDFPIEDMYGDDFVSAVTWIQTPIAEDFGTDYLRRVNALTPGQCLIYVIDSVDALVPDAAADRMQKILDEQKAPGSMGAEKAKFFSSGFFNHLCKSMQGKDSTLICISQVREKIGQMFGEKHYRTGGKALDFYTHQVCWLAHTGKLDKTFRGQKRTYGVTVKANFKRNKVAKPFRMAEFSILFDYGIDDINSLIDYMYGDKEIKWGDKTFKRQSFISFLEDSPEDLAELKTLAEKDWLEVEAAVVPKRKSRFTKR